MIRNLTKPGSVDKEGKVHGSVDVNLETHEDATEDGMTEIRNPADKEGD